VHVPTEPSVLRDRVFRFGSFELSEREGELRKGGVRIKLQEQPFRVLVELVANAGRLVSREDLHQKLWPSDTFVDFDVGLNSAIRKLRQALNDDADHPHYIETLAKRGYRFVAPIADSAAAPLTTREDRPSGTVVSVPGDGTDAATGQEIQREPHRWYWVLAACALALVVYGAVAFGPRFWKSQLAIEQRITANPPEAPVTGAVVSPDGKYVAYSDTTGVYIRHIDTGETRPLQLPKGFDAVPASWFPDSAHMLMSVVEGAQTAPSLWKVSILGGSPQKITDDASEAAVSPDGSKIAFLRDAFDVKVVSTFTGRAREIWLADTNGSNPRRLSVAELAQDSESAARPAADRRYSAVFFYRLAWSPDGSRIAYFRIYASGSNEKRFSLETIGVNGGPAKVVESSVHFWPALYWAADGRLLYASRDDPGSEGTDYGIWSVRVNEKTGEPEGKPTQLTKGVGQIGGLSVTANNRRLILSRVNAFAEVFLTEIDRETGRLKVVRRLTLDEHKNFVDAWTPDSSAILFTSNRNGTFQLFRQAIDRTMPELLVDGRTMSLPRLNPDGTQILYLTGPDPKDPAHMNGVMQVPLLGGTPRLLLQKPLIENIQCALSPSNLCFLSIRIGSATQFFSFDPKDGKTQEFASFQVSEDPDWSLSPDGSQLALIFHGPERKVTFMNVGDKSTHEITLNEWPLQQIDWASDGKSVFVSSQTLNGAPVILSVLPSGDHRVLLEGDNGLRFLAVVPSPDGRYGALQAVTGENNVWMVENF
jgi:DNA-binding winged helix-turn-helix (wHTH) protein/Tol biopolymer transport system component